MSKSGADEQNEREHDGMSPVSSQQRDKKSADRPEPKGQKIHEDKKQDRMKQVQPEIKGPQKAEKKKPEDEPSQVKAAALELAKKLDSIKKAKVCYATKDREWWAIFYQDTESAIEIRQFFWNL